MVKVYIQSINNISINELKLNQFPKYRREKLARIKDGRSKLHSYTAGLLLSEHISNKEIKLNEYGKPYCDGVYFNLSHSGDYVILAISDGTEVGCDIEYMKQADYMRLGKVVYTENELAALTSSEDMRLKFYEFWTKKEAFMKCIGEGFHFPVKSLDITLSPEYVFYNGEKLYFVDYMLDDYRIMICSSDKDVNFIR